jgi:hypothetical protein
MVQEAKPLCPEFRSQTDDTGDIAARPVESTDETSLDPSSARASSSISSAARPGWRAVGHPRALEKIKLII